MDINSKSIWQSDRAAVVYSFLANIAIYLGYSQQHINELVKIHNELFNCDFPQKNTLEYEMLEPLGKLPNTYHMKEIVKYNTWQKNKVKEWYTKILTIDTTIETQPLFMIEIKKTNKFILSL